MLNVTVFALPTNTPDGDDKAATEGVLYENVDFVSLVNNETYGPPALVAPQRPGASGESSRPLAQVGEKVLYINTNIVPLFEIERASDR